MPAFPAIMSYGRGNNECRIYVGNLPPDIRTKDIEDLFYKFGKIVFIDLKNRRGPPFAFVEFEDSRWVSRRPCRPPGPLVPGPLSLCLSRGPITRKCVEPSRGAGRPAKHRNVEVRERVAGSAHALKWTSHPACMTTLGRPFGSLAATQGTVQARVGEAAGSREGCF